MENHNYIKTPWVYLLVTWLPIVLIAGFFPAYATVDPWLRIDRFIDEEVFGVVGFWSSNFPFSAKVITNYIGLFGPLFGGWLFFWKFRELPENAGLYKRFTILNFFCTTVVMVALYVFIIYISYFSFEDMAVKQKMRIFGLNEYVFALYSCFVMALHYLLFFMAYTIFFRIPRALYRRFFIEKVERS